MPKLRLTALGLVAAVFLAWQTLPAAADTSDAQAVHQGIVEPANLAIKQFLADQKRAAAQAQAQGRPQQSDAQPLVPPAPSDIAQLRPVGEIETPVSMPGFPSGISYTLDFSAAQPFGNTGRPSSAGMSGGMDLNFFWTFSKYRRLALGYYELQEYPIGFDTGIVPVYLQGVATPIGTQNLNAPPGPQNVMVKNKFFIASFQNMFVLDTSSWLHGIKIPLIVSPTLTSRWGNVAGGTDLLPIELNGFPSYQHYRTVQYLQVGLTVPVLSTSKMFGTISVIPWWNTALNGANTVNHMQVGKIAYLEYNPTSRISAFIEPSLIPSMLPIDYYPEHLSTILYGASYKFTPWTFVQGVISSGGATNVSPYGITALTCTALPCTSPSTIFPTIAGLHAAQFQLKFGIGTPSVLPL